MSKSTSDSSPDRTRGSRYEDPPFDLRPTEEDVDARPTKGSNSR